MAPPPSDSRLAPGSGSGSAPQQLYNSHSSPTNPTDRVRHIADHMASPVLTTNFPAEAVPKAPEDPLFGLMAAYRADTSPDKVDLVGLNLFPSMNDVAYNAVQ